MRDGIHRSPRRAAALGLLLAASAAARAQQVAEFPEDGVVVRDPPAAAPSQVCDAGARWLRLGFAALSLRGRDALTLTSSGGDRQRFAGAQWNGRRFHARALRGGCVFLRADFRDPRSRFRLSDYQAGATALATTTATVGGAGDICSNTTPANCRRTSDLIVAMDPVVALTFGDNAYASGTLAEYTNDFAPAWGRFKPLVAPVPGNHEYLTAGASGYFDYFNGVGQQTGPAGDRSQGWYSYDVGDWHFIALNSRSGSTVPTAQLAWLDADIAANTKPCTAAYFHHPLLSRGRYDGYATMKPLFDRLYAARADLVLNGHDHGYQRYAPMDGSQVARADGVREVIVGTGGAELTPITRTHPLLQAAQGSTFGVLRLDLSSTGYAATFVPVAGATWTDSFHATCHRAIAVTPDFLLNATATIGIPLGRSGSKAITANSYGDFHSPVTLAVSGLPAGVGAAFSVNPLVPPPDASATSRLTLRVSSTTPPGTYTITVKGTAGTLVRKVAFKLTVTSA